MNDKPATAKVASHPVIIACSGSDATGVDVPSSIGSTPNNIAMPCDMGWFTPQASPTRAPMAAMSASYDGSMGSLPEGEPLLSRGGSTSASMLGHHSILHLDAADARPTDTPLQDVLLRVVHVPNSAASATHTVHEAAALCDAQLVAATQRLAGLLDAVCSPPVGAGSTRAVEGVRTMALTMDDGGEEGEGDGVVAASPEQLSEVGQQLQQVSAKLWEQLEVQSNPEYGFPAALEHLMTKVHASATHITQLQRRVAQLRKDKHDADRALHTANTHLQQQDMALQAASRRESAILQELTSVRDGWAAATKKAAAEAQKLQGELRVAMGQLEEARATAAAKQATMEGQLGHMTKEVQRCTQVVATLRQAALEAEAALEAQALESQAALEAQALESQAALEAAATQHAALEDMLQGLQERIVELEKVEALSNAAVSDMHVEMQQRAKELAQTKKELATAQHAQHTMNASLNSSQQALHESQHALHDSQQREEQLLTKLRAAIKRGRAAESARDALKEQMHETQQKAAAVRAEAAQIWEQEVDALQGQLSSAQQQHKAQVNSLQGQLSSAQQQVKQYEMEVEELRGALEVAHTARRELQQEVDALQQQRQHDVDALHGQLATVQQQHQQEIDTLQAQLHTVQQQHQQEIDTLQAQLHTVQQQHQQEIDTLQAQLHTVEQQLEQAQATIDSHAHIADREHHEVHNVRQQLHNTQQQYQEKVDSLQTQLKKVQEERQQEVDALQTQVSLAQQQHDTQRDALQQQLNIAQQQLQEQARQQMEATTQGAKVATLQQALEAQRAQHEDAQCRLELVQQDAHELAEALQEKEHEFEKKEHVLKEKEHALRDKENECNALLEQVQALNEELHAVRTEACAAHQEHEAAVAAALEQQQQQPQQSSQQQGGSTTAEERFHAVDLNVPPLREDSPEAQPIPPANDPPTVHRRNPGVNQEIIPLEGAHTHMNNQEEGDTIAAWSDAGSASKRKRPWTDGPAHVVVQVDAAQGVDVDKSYDKALVVLDGAQGLLPWGDGEHQAWFVPSVGLTKRMASNPGVWHTTLQLSAVQSGPRWVRQGALMLDHYVLLAQQMVRKHPTARIGAVAYLVLLHLLALAVVVL